MKQARNETHSKRRGIQKPDLIRQQRSEPLIDPDILSQAAIDADADVALDADAVLAVRLVGTGAIVADAAGAEREAAHDAVAGPEGRDGCADGGHGARALVRGGLGQPAGAEDAGAHHAVRVAVGGYRYLDDDVVGAGWGRDGHPGAELVWFVEGGHLDCSHCLGEERCCRHVDGWRERAWLRSGTRKC